MTTAHDAPASMPSSPGSASGLRVWPCIRAPATPSAMPTAIASTVRGTRSACTIVAASDPSSWNSTSTTVPRGIGRLPSARLSSPTTPSANSSSTSPRTEPRRTDGAGAGAGRCSAMRVDMEG